MGLNVYNFTLPPFSRRSQHTSIIFSQEVRDDIIYNFIKSYDYVQTLTR